MGDTKERILIKALHLFASDGYEAVSVSAIAGQLGITKGALYRHYKSKRDIFDRIVEKMYQLDAARSRQYQVPEDTYAAAPAAYRAVSIQSIRAFTLAQFSFWTQDAFASDFRRMLALEQYRNAEMAALYSQCIVSGPAAYMKDVFREMILDGTLREADPELLAGAYYAPVFWLIQVADHCADHRKLQERLSRHIEAFFAEYARIDCHTETEPSVSEKE